MCTEMEIKHEISSRSLNMAKQLDMKTLTRILELLGHLAHAWLTLFYTRSTLPPSAYDQVLALTTHIENGFQKDLKRYRVLLDQTATYAI
eukprot:g39711.t1